MKIIIVASFFCLAMMLTVTNGRPVGNSNSGSSRRSISRVERDAQDAHQNILERLREIESFPDLAKFLSSASPCLQPVLAEQWQTMQRERFENRRRKNRYSRAIELGKSVSRSQHTSSDVAPS